MIKFLAVVLSAVAMAGLVYAFGPVILVGLPLIVLAMLFSEMPHGQRDAEQLQNARRSNQATDF